MHHVLRALAHVVVVDKNVFLITGSGDYFPLFFRKRREINMYYLFKENNFYLELDNGGIYLKNEFGAIKIDKKGAYNVFLNLISLLDGQQDIEQAINEIDNSNIKQTYKSILEILVGRNFLYYSEAKIDLHSFQLPEKALLPFISNLDFITHNTLKSLVEVEASNSQIYNIFCLDSLKYFDEIRFKENNEINCIKISYGCQEECLKSWNIYCVNGDLVASKSMIDNTPPINLQTFPKEFLKLLFNVVTINILIDLYYGQRIEQFKDYYVLDTKLLQIS